MTALSLFVSHGAPDLLTTSCPAQTFLLSLGQELARPEAIIVISAHHDSTGVEISSGSNPETIHDFWGFDPELHQIKYGAPGAPVLAQKIAKDLAKIGMKPNLDSERGFDHGAWVPLGLMFPAANIPVVQVSLNRNQNADWHFRLGKGLKPFRDQNILVIGSGSLTHNLRAFGQNRKSIDSPTPNWVSGFNDWVHNKILNRDQHAIIEALDEAPNAKDNHPTDEHFLPFIVALGAGDISTARRIHKSYTYGVLSMDAYSF